jgi:Double zinc ribbon
MTERQSPCPRCCQENPPRNRFCGSCGTPLTSREQLATREEHRPVPAGRAWPSKFGPVSKALAAALATEAGLSWLRHKAGAEVPKAHLSLPGSSSGVEVAYLWTTAVGAEDAEG